MMNGRFARTVALGPLACAIDAIGSSLPLTRP